jgi:hypothetical protein
MSFSLLVFELPEGVAPNVDPSWRFGISKAAAMHLPFGEAIVFTFGPLGYLIDGAMLQSNYKPLCIFRLMMHVGYFFLIFITTLRLRKYVHKVLLNGTVFLAYCYGMNLEYEIVCSLCLLLALFDSHTIIFSRYQRFISLLMGSLGGFLFLTKFTLGIYSFGSWIVFVGSSLFTTQKIVQQRRQTLLSLLISLGACWVTMLALLFPQNLALELFFLIASIVFCGCFVFSIQQVESSKKFLSSSSGIHSLLSASFFREVSLYTLCIGVVTFTYSQNILPLFRYLTNAIEIASGYSSGMSYTDIANQLDFLLFLTFFVAVVLLYTAYVGGAGFAILAFLIAFLSFKHGVVRLDTFHVWQYFTVLFVVTVLCFDKLAFNHNRSAIKKVNENLLTLATYLFSFSLFLCSSDFIHYERLTQGRGRLFFETYGNLEAFAHSVNKQSKNDLTTLQLPQRVLQKIGQASIDIVPKELSLLQANNLQWIPRPVIQSYSTYTKKLDDLNRNALMNKGPEYILYEFFAIDSRHPFFDEPATFLYLFCGYTPIDYYSSENLVHYILLKKATSSQCSSQSEAVYEKIVQEGEVLPLEASHKELQLLKINLQYSFLGIITKFFYKIPAVYLKVTHLDGTVKSFRFLQENAQNGIIVNMLPQTHSQSYTFWKREFKQNVNTLAIVIDTPWAFKKEIRIKLEKRALCSY